MINLIKNNVFLSLLIWSSLITVVFNSCNSGEGAVKNSVDDHVDQLISKMTLEEKVGQMTQVTIDMILKDGDHETVDPEKLEKAILEKKVGSILNASGHAYSLEVWHEMINQIQKVALEKTLNNIPVLYGIDAIHGAGYTRDAVLYPHNIGMAATRNKDLIQRIAQATAKEVRASGIRWNFDPVMGIGRQPLWSRFEETFGEDPYICSSMGVAAIQGYEGDGLEKNTSVAACMKHFIGYSVPASGKDRTPAYIPEVVLREYFLPPFEAAAKSGVATVMINSGEINGVPVHASKYLLTDVLRKEIGFEGVAVSDWEDVIRLKVRHRVAATPKEAVKIAVNAGLDMSMVPMDYSFYDLLVELVEEGEVHMERIDEAVRRILKLKIRLGLFENPFPEPASVNNFGLDEFKHLAHEAARESITLVKNETVGESNILPLSKQSKVLLTGPGANNISSLHGSWSYTWQGNDANQYPETTLTIKEAFETAIGKKNVLCNAEEIYMASANYDQKDLIAQAKKVDYIVLCLGEDAYAESPGGIDNLKLDERQLALATAAASTGKPLIFVLVEGRPRIIEEIQKYASAIVVAYRPGSKGAEAITEVLLGDYNPDGVLPFTYQRYPGDVLMYDHKYSEKFREPEPGRLNKDGYRPQWPFGHGLSYTTFEYSPIQLNKSQIKDEEKLEVTVSITNKGARDGKVAVDLYTRDLYASITPNQQRLRKYQKVFIAAGDKQTVSFTLDKQDLSFINADGIRVTESGEFEVMVGDKKVGFEYIDSDAL